MRHQARDISRLLLFLVALWSGAQAWGDDGLQPAEIAAAGTTPATAGRAQLTHEALQHELFQFVDRYREKVGQAADEGVRRSASGANRVMYQATKVSYVSAAISIVSGPRPIDALRDLMVMVRLQRMVWESGAGGQIAPADSAPMTRVLETLEGEIFALATRVLPADAIAQLRTLIDGWRRDNLDQHYVAFVRFQNLAASPGADAVDEVVSSGGFLAPVESVAREAHEARLLAERTLFLANRMPALIGWQAELAYQRIMASPEALEVLGDLRGYRAAIERLGTEVERLPDRVAKERRELVADVERALAEERSESLGTLQTIIRAEREALFDGLDEGARAYAPLLEQLAAATAAMRDAVAGLERLGASGEAESDRDALEEVHAITERLAHAARDTNEVVVGLNALFNAEMRGLSEVDALLATQLQRLFWYAVVLVLLAGLVAYGVMRATRR